MTHVDFVIEHPGVPRIMFGELQRAENSGPKRLARALVRKYSQRLQKLLEAGKAQGELNIALDSEAAAILFIGTIQGLVMQSLLAGDVARIRRDAPRVFEIYLRGIRGTP